MSVKFKPTQIAMPLSANYGRWYAKMVATGTVTAADFGAQNIRSYHVNYQPFRRFVGNGEVSAKNRRLGTFVSDLLDGVTAKEAPKNSATATTADDGNN